MGIYANLWNNMSMLVTMGIMDSMGVMGVCARLWGFRGVYESL